MAAVFVLCLLALEAFHTWQRVNALFAWANQQAAQQVAPLPRPPVPQPEPTKSPEAKK